MYYYSRKMLFDASAYVNQNEPIKSRRFRKIKYLKLSENNKKRLAKKIAKDEKLIYAFFLDIA